MAKKKTSTTRKFTPAPGQPAPPEGFPIPRFVTPEPFEVPGAWFDQEAVDRVTRFFRTLRHTKTRRWANTPFELEPWQVYWYVRPVFGWKDRDGNRLITTVWFETPKKNGKTSVSSGTGLYMLSADREPGAEIYAAARAKKQARYIFDPAVQMARGSPALRQRLRPLTEVIYYPATGSKFEVVSADALLMHGPNVYAGLIDEVHGFANRDIVDFLEAGTASREQPLILFTTTADESRDNSIYNEKRKYVEQLATRVLHDPTFYGVVFAADDDDDPFAEETWRKANPGYGVTVTRTFLEKEANAARTTPAKLARFKQLHCGIRARTDTRWLGIGHWDHAGGEHNIIDEQLLEGEYAIGGLDLSSSQDLTALNWTFPFDDHYEAIWRYWLPEARLEDLNSRTAGQAALWVKQGWLKLTDGDVIDEDAIFAQIDRDLRRFDVPKRAGMGYDRWGMNSIAQRLNKAAGSDEFVVPIGQGFHDMDPPMKFLERLILKHVYMHGGNPVSRWMFDNLAVKLDAAGNIKPDKDKSADKIDGISAQVTALAVDLRLQSSRPRSAQLVTF